MIVTIATIVLAFSFASPIAAQTTASQFSLISDVQFCTGGGTPLLMDIFIPKQRIRTPTPALLWIHGGGWKQGDKNHHVNAALLADAGFVAATLSYRLSGNSPFPAAIEDCKCAIRFLRANAAKYGIDPDHIGVAGSSSGGHLAELVATADQSAGLEGNGGWPNVSSKVQAAASYFGLSDLTAPFPPDIFQEMAQFFRGTEKQKPDLYRKASPIFYVSKDNPPLLLVHGEKDDGVPFEQSVRMADACRRFGVPVEFIAVKNAGHDFERIGDAPISPSIESIRQSTIDFFKQYLVSRP